MSRTDWAALIYRLRGTPYQRGVITPESVTHRIEFDAGLSDAEVLSIESEFGFRFPPDLRAFLQTALPRGSGFPDWRSGDRRVLHDWLDEPRHGILFDVERAAFWLDEWGPRPSTQNESLNVASDILRTVPRLIPIFAHRMMPDEPNDSGNPIYSVHQTDIIYYGFDLTQYLEAEFHLERSQPSPATPRPIRFWDLIVS
jgi:hypothetical protein